MLEPKPEKWISINMNTSYLNQFVYVKEEKKTFNNINPFKTISETHYQIN